MDGDAKNEEAADDDEPEEAKKGLHGFDPLHVKEMNGAMLGFGPDLARGRTLEPIDQVDVYLLICRLLNITVAAGKNDADDRLLEQFIRDENDDSDEQRPDGDDSESSEEQPPAGAEEGQEPDGQASKQADGTPAKARSRWANRDSGAGRLAGSCWTYSSAAALVWLAGLLGRWS